MSPNSATNVSSVDCLSAEQQERLAQILEQYLADRERGLSPDPMELVVSEPDLANAIEEYIEGLEFLHQATSKLSVSDRGQALPMNFSDTRLGDFSILREIGHGGMGIVYEARQVSLDRRVALKVLPFAAVLDRRQIARFTNEAQAAAQLHHPNIVPVFAVGCERGVHYYAMQYIEGQSLDRAIRELRESIELQGSSVDSDTRSEVSPSASDSTSNGFSTARSIETRHYIRAVAQLGIEAAEGLHHAHEFGIVHRDVKPSNLLLDAEGKVWVTDFGLARLPIDAGLTVTGDVLGTLRYMSPEQAAGRASSVDERADVYSLGITLYELLTLREAFDGNDRNDLLRRIGEEEPRRPRRINPAIAVDLETIILKATAKSRDHRYETAHEMAEDLRRFLEGLPTLARRPSLADRAVMWARRHRTVVRSAIVAIGVLLVGLIISTLLIVREHSRTKDALAKAESNYRQVRELLDRFGLRHAQELAKLPGAEPLRRELLSDTLTYYHQFIEHAGDDPELRADLAVTYIRSGKITEQLGDNTDALAAYQQAATMLEELVRTHPGIAKHRSDLALCHNNIGLVLSRAGKTSEAEREYRQAITIEQRLIVENPQETRYQSDLALAYGNLGLLQQATDREQAEASYQASIELQRQLSEQHPERPDYRSHLAISLNNLSYFYSIEDASKAENPCCEAIGILTGLVESHPEVLSHQSDLALSCNNLGAILARLDRPEEAIATYRRAITYQEQLQRKGPAVVAYRRDLAVSQNNLGRLLSRSDEPAKAEASFAAARSILENLVDDYPGELHYRSSLAGVLNNQAVALEELDRVEEALESSQQAIAHQQVAVRCGPEIAAFQKFLGLHYGTYVQILRRSDRHDEATEATAAWKKLCDRDPRPFDRKACDMVLAIAETKTSRKDGEKP